MKRSIKYKGFDFEYNLFYLPSERPSFNSDGCDEEIEITNITLNGISVYDLLGDEIFDLEKFIIYDLKQV